MGTIYRVREWDDHYENNKSRERDECSFVCVPNKQDGMGFTRLMAMEDGAVVYGVFCLILGACSRQQRPRQGWLTDDGTEDGEPWTIEDMALRWRRTEDEIKRALEVLSSGRISWLESHGDRIEGGQQRTPSPQMPTPKHKPDISPQFAQVHTNQSPIDCPPSARPVPAECPSGALERREGNRREGIERTAAAEGKLPVVAVPPFDAAAASAALNLEEAIEDLEGQGFSRADADRLANVFGWQQVEVAIRNANHLQATEKLKGTKGGYIKAAIDGRYPILPQLANHEMAEDRKSRAVASAEQKRKAGEAKKKQDQVQSDADKAEMDRLSDADLSQLKSRALEKLAPSVRERLADKDPRVHPMLGGLVITLIRNSTGPPAQIAARVVSESELRSERAGAA